MRGEVESSVVGCRALDRSCPSEVAGPVELWHVLGWGMFGWSVVVECELLC